MIDEELDRCTMRLPTFAVRLCTIKFHEEQCLVLDRTEKIVLPDQVEDI